MSIEMKMKMAARRQAELLGVISALIEQAVEILARATDLARKLAKEAEEDED